MVSQTTLENTRPVQGLEIQKAVVIGAGLMGSGIAAHLANAGVSVYLLDIVPPDASDRNCIANGAIERMRKATPATDPLSAGFMHPSNAKRIIPGNIEDHLEEAVKDADWIVEAVIEDLKTKQQLYARLDPLRKPTAIVSSNTSTIPLSQLVEGRSESFKRYFAITHFFNPPRFMHLLELVGSPDTEQEVMETLKTFGDVRLGKNVIICKDTPAFIANRIGIYWMFRAMTETLKQQMPIEQVDAILGCPMGYPKDGVFGLLDLVGLGVIPHVAQSLIHALPQTDAFHALDKEGTLSLVQSLLQDGRTGRKSPKGGFYRMQKREDGSKQKQALNLQTGAYDDVGKPRSKSLKAAKSQGPRAVFETDDALGRFAWMVMRDVLLYAASLVPEISDDIADVDAAMRDGYNAKWGPFEFLDKLGVAWFCQKVQSDGLELPPVLALAGGRPFYREQNGRLSRLVFDLENNRATYAELPQVEGVLRLADIKRRESPLISHYSASLWDIGDGVTCLEFHSKMNTLDPSILWVINEAVQWMARHQDRYKAMVIYNDAKNFSLGANLGLITAGFHLARTGFARTLGLSGLINNSMYGLIEAMVYHGQSVFKALQQAPFPVVGAPQGMALGGGCEILLHCDALQASAETYMGLVETGVGVVPAWGGCTQLLARCQAVPDRLQGAMISVKEAFQTLMMPQFSTSTSALDAQRKHWLRPGDGITMNPERLLADAKARALAMVEGYAPPEPVTYQLPGVYGKTALRLAIDDFYIKGEATWHDVVVADALADILSGGETFVGTRLTESDLMQLEREHFLSLLKTGQTQKRIDHTLKTGKPLREPPLQTQKSLDEIRAMRQVERLPQKTVTGKPLQGVEALKLKMMAEITAQLLKRVSK